MRIRKIVKNHRYVLEIAYTKGPNGVIAETTINVSLIDGDWTTVEMLDLAEAMSEIASEIGNGD